MKKKQKKKQERLNKKRKKKALAAIGALGTLQPLALQILAICPNWKTVVLMGIFCAVSILVGYIIDK